MENNFMDYNNYSEYHFNIIKDQKILLWLPISAQRDGSGEWSLPWESSTNPFYNSSEENMRESIPSIFSRCFSKNLFQLKLRSNWSFSTSRGRGSEEYKKSDKGNRISVHLDLHTTDKTNLSALNCNSKFIKSKWVPLTEATRWLSSYSKLWFWNGMVKDRAASGV